MAVDLGRSVAVAERVAGEVVVAVSVGNGAFVSVGGNAVGAGGAVGCDGGNGAASSVAADAGCCAAGGVTTATAAGEAVAAPAVTNGTGAGVSGITSGLGGLLQAPRRIAAITVVPRTTRIDIVREGPRRVIM
jgi:hypothetical protein